MIANYGSWKSPITSDLIVAESIGLGGVTLDGEDIYWLEMRPAEKGRSVIVKRAADGTTQDVTPPVASGYNVRTRVHEYGGGAYAVHNGIAYFSNFADQQLYGQRAPQSQPAPFTHANGLRFADGVIDAQRQRMVCVAEDHRATGEAINSIMSIPLAAPHSSVHTNVVTTLVDGHDFFAAPRLSPDGKQLAWLAWDHPLMPWDGTELWLADVSEDGTLHHARAITGSASESIVQPQWSPDGTLHFISDRTGWWNLYCWRNDKAELLCERAAEFAQPQWVFGQSTYAFLDTTTILCAFIERGFAQLATLDATTGKLEVIATPYSRIDGIKAANHRAVFVAGSPTESTCIVLFDAQSKRFTTLQQSNKLALDAAYVSAPQAIEFPTENGLTAHGFYYAPKNKDFSAPADEKPPLLVMSHGGPTAMAAPTLDLEIQYWTSRGWAVLDVNYGGSTGFGRAYRERLKGNWGIVDVADCVNGARHLVAQGLANGNRLAITGGSAGGYTTLCALTFSDLFKAGASHYGVSDLIALDEDTHKFESRYTFSLVGTSHELYRARSPIHHTEKLNAPVIFFQGLEDKIVLPNQAEMMVNALRAKGLPVAYVAFEGEQHGFRQAANIKRALDGEFYFYSRVFGFTTAEEIEPVAIENLPENSR
ncbi:MAG: S9 family peptidase [Acidobacteria bacterium]|nr:S9 family peptidase [Acidobacteriota bacterium]